MYLTNYGTNNFKLCFFYLTVIFFITTNGCKPEYKKYSKGEFNGKYRSVETDSGYLVKSFSQVGTRFEYQIKSKSATKIELEDNPIKMANESTVLLDYELISDSSGTKLIKITYKKVHLVITKKDGEIETADSDNPRNALNSLDNILGALKDAYVYVTLNSNSTLQKIEGIKQILDKALASLIDMNENQKQKVKDMLNGLLGDQFFTDNLNQSAMTNTTVIYEGLTWQSKSKVTTALPFTFNTRYDVSKIDANAATIDFDGDLENGKNENVPLLGTYVSTDVTGNFTGNYSFELLSGMLNNATTKASVKGNITVRGKEVPISLEQNKSIRVKKL